MRVIKFRAWSKKEKAFIDDFIIDRLGNEYQYNKCEFWGDDRDVILMQYIGLKDKNGNDIYEGDVVKFFFCRDHWAAKCACSTEMVDYVKFQDGSYWFVWYETKMKAYAREYASRCKVIGNIYENPNLTKKTP